MSLNKKCPIYKKQLFSEFSNIQRQSTFFKKCWIIVTRSVNNSQKDGYKLYAQLRHLREMTRNFKFLKVTLNWFTHSMSLVYVKTYFSLGAYFFHFFTYHSNLYKYWLQVDKICLFVGVMSNTRREDRNSTLGHGGTKIIIVGWPGFHDTLRKCTLTKYRLLPWWRISSVCRNFNGHCT